MPIFPRDTAKDMTIRSSSCMRRFYKSILDPVGAGQYPQFADGLRQLTILEAELASSQKHGWVEVR